AARHADRLTVIHRLDVRDGFIDDAAVRSYIADRVGAEFYICGPTPFMDTVEKTLVAAGADAASIHIERFSSITDESEVAGEGAAERQVTIHLDGAAFQVG